MFAISSSLSVSCAGRKYGAPELAGWLSEIRIVDSTAGLCARCVAAVYVLLSIGGGMCGAARAYHAFTVSGMLERRAYRAPSIERLRNAATEGEKTGENDTRNGKSVVLQFAALVESRIARSREDPPAICFLRARARAALERKNRFGEAKDTLTPPSVTLIAIIARLNRRYDIVERLLRACDKRRRGTKEKFTFANCHDRYAFSAHRSRGTIRERFDAMTQRASS